MTRRWHIAALCTIGITALGGCSQQLLPQPGAATPSGETASLPAPPVEAGPGDMAFTVSADATEVYSLVARGALNCWFGAEGPLKATHAFQAEAAPPAQGGAATIVLQERDVTLPDQRGVRAFRVSLTPGGGGTQVVTAASKIQPHYAAAMMRDVEVWARGGQGCQLRVVAPPPPKPVPPPRVAKGKATR